MLIQLNRAPNSKLQQNLSRAADFGSVCWIWWMSEVVLTLVCLERNRCKKCENGYLRGGCSPALQFERSYARLFHVCYGPACGIRRNKTSHYLHISFKNVDTTLRGKISQKNDWIDPIIVCTWRLRIHVGSQPPGAHLRAQIHPRPSWLHKNKYQVISPGYKVKHEINQTGCFTVYYNHSHSTRARLCCDRNTFGV